MFHIFFYFFFIDYQLIRPGAKCSANNKTIGEKLSLEECFQKCRKRDDCKFFTYGIGKETGKCRVDDQECKLYNKEWMSAEYDFYGTRGKDTHRYS